MTLRLSGLQGVAGMPDGANAYPAYKMLPGCRMALRLSGLQYVAGMPDGANAYPAYKRFPYIAHGP